jgi:RNA recognition motif-containing protein
VVDRAVRMTNRPSGCTTLFVKGLPYDMDEEGVKGAFAKFGVVVSVRLVRWNHTGQHKGFGYVQFEHGYAAEAAAKVFCSTTGLSIGGRKVMLDWDTKAPKASFRTGDHQYYAKTDEGNKALSLLRPASSGSAASAGAEAVNAPVSDAKRAKRKAEKQEKKRQQKMLQSVLASGGEGKGKDAGDDSADEGERRHKKEKKQSKETPAADSEDEQPRKKSRKSREDSDDE